MVPSGFNLYKIYSSILVQGCCRIKMNRVDSHSSSLQFVALKNRATKEHWYVKDYKYATKLYNPPSTYHFLVCRK